MLHLIFDTETTGLPKSWSEPFTNSDNWPRLVQLSWILSDGTNNLEFDYIIKPEGFIIPDEVSKIHGIDNERALKEGKNLREVMLIFASFLKVSQIIVGHNIKFDNNIVNAEFFRLGDTKMNEEICNKNSYCTMMNSMIGGNHGGGNKWPKLIELHTHLFNEGFNGAHNSLIDTRACARCYFELLKRNNKETYEMPKL